jgi:hypothetical protein
MHGSGLPEMTRTHALPPGAMHTMLWLWHAFA